MQLVPLVFQGIVVLDEACTPEILPVAEHLSIENAVIESFRVIVEAAIDIPSIAQVMICIDVLRGLQLAEVTEEPAVIYRRRFSVLRTGVLVITALGWGPFSAVGCCFPIGLIGGYVLRLPCFSYGVSFEQLSEERLEELICALRLWRDRDLGQLQRDGESPNEVADWNREHLRLSLDNMLHHANPE